MERSQSYTKRGRKTESQLFKIKSIYICRCVFRTAKEGG